MAETREPLTPLFAPGQDMHAVARQCSSALGEQGGGMVLMLSTALHEAIQRINDLTADVDALKAAARQPTGSQP